MTSRIGWYIVGNGYYIQDILNGVYEFMNQQDAANHFALLWDAYGCLNSLSTYDGIRSAGLDITYTQTVPEVQKFIRMPRATVTAYVSYPSTFNAVSDTRWVAPSSGTECWNRVWGDGQSSTGRNAITVCKLGFFFSPGASLTSGLLGPSDTAIIQQSGSTPYITRGGLWWTNPVPAGSPNIPENFWNLQRNHFDTLNLPTVMQKQSNSTNIYGFASTSDVSVRLYGPVYSKGSYRLPDPIVTIIEVPSSGGGGGGTTQITTDTNAQLFWADARNLNISYDTLWIKWPSVMPSVAAVVYQMRELSSIATSLVNTSGDRQKLVEIASNLSADVHPTRKSLLQQYPVESLVYANEIDTLLHPSRQERMEQERAVYGALGNASKSMFDVFQEYPDVDMGGVDWIGIDRLQKTGMHL